MNLQISDSIIRKSKLTKEDLLLRLAIELFREELVTLGQGANLAGLHQSQFQKELAKRKIPIHYGIEEFEEDLKTIKSLGI